MTKKLIRDVLGSPIPQYYNEGSGFYVANTNGTGDATGVDFSKKKLIRDVLGSVIPQYYDVAEGKFKPVTSDGSNGPVSWNDFIDKPTEFNPIAHYHEISNIKGLDTELNKISSETEFGRVKVDGKTIKIDENGVISAVVGNIDDETDDETVIYGVKINTNNSNPETALTYTDDAIDFTPAKGNNSEFLYGSWEDKFPFNLLKPCVVKNKKINYYLNPNDYKQKLDGSPADITSGVDGDVFIRFPKIYWKFEKIGTDIYIRISNKKADDGFKALAHTRDNVDVGEIFIGAYLGYELDGKLRSLSGYEPTVSKTIGAFRTLAQSNGVGYEQTTFHQLTMLQILFIIMFKNRDSQTAIGRGCVDGNSTSIITGGSDQKGLFYGENTGKHHVKFCGIEDFWGNIYYWIDGLFYDDSKKILIGNNNFNDTGIGYSDFDQGNATNLGGYISGIQGSTETGFIIKSSGGSDTTHFSDFGNLYSSSLPIFGASYYDGSDGGAFQLIVDYSATNANSTTGSRLTVF